MKMKKTNTIILVLTFLLSIISSAYLTGSIAPAVRAETNPPPPNVPLPKRLTADPGKFHGKVVWYRTVGAVLAIVTRRVFVLSIDPSGYVTVSSPTISARNAEALTNVRASSIHDPFVAIGSSQWDLLNDPPLIWIVVAG
jgi:hypothetical protein